ncbi:hypothetical protein ACG7TL_005378 [Trametes sanguinea]
MKSRGLEIERPVVPTSLEVSENQELLEDPSEYPVKVVLKSAGCSDDASEVVQARFVIGADGGFMHIIMPRFANTTTGAHSWVRKTLGISMIGEESEFIWGVIDIVPDTDFPDARNLCVVHSHAGSALLIPRERDMLRLYIQLSNADVVDPETGRVDRQRASPQKILAIAQKILKPYRMNAVGEFDWWTMYIVGQRCAEAYSRHERVFIAGDACHTHSPKGGQGMNASMGDTHNLAWKLAYVVRGWARMALLKTYELERLTFAKTLIDFDRKFAAVFSGKDTPDVSHEELHNMYMENGEYVSGVELQYAVSPVVVNDHQAVASKLSIGKRMIPHVFIGAADAVPVDIQDKLLADLRFKVLVFVGDITDKDVANKLQKLTEKLQEPDGFLGRYDHAGKVFDLLGISASSKDAVDYTDFPQLLRSHWSKILLDDRDMHARVGGGGFQAYGIDPRVGAIVVVRPDGHVGLVAPFDRPDVVDAYFGGFMLPIAAAAQAP